MGDESRDEATESAVDAFFRGHPDSLAVYERVRAAIEGIGVAETRVSRSQLAFRRRRGFAFLWQPGRWLRKPNTEVVLSIALPREVRSPRFKQVAHPSPKVWMHHLEVGSPEEIDGEVAGWLREGWEGAG